jgi:hypothetical protein
VTCATPELDSRAKPMTIPAEMLQMFRFIVPLFFSFVGGLPDTTGPWAVSALASKLDRLEPVVGVVSCWNKLAGPHQIVGIVYIEP